MPREAPPPPAKLSDLTSLTEAVTARVDLSVSVAEAVTVSERVSALNPLPGVSVADQLSVSESAAVALGVDVAVNDSAALSEAVSVVVSAPSVGSLSVSVSESVTLAEAIAADAALNVTVTELVIVTDAFIRAPVGFTSWDALFSTEKSTRLTDTPRGEVDPSGYMTGRLPDTKTFYL